VTIQPTTAAVESGLRLSPCSSVPFCSWRQRRTLRCYTVPLPEPCPIQAARTLSYNRNSSDSKITYIPTDRTTFFGRYSVDPFTVADPQELGAAGGGTFDGGQAGAAAGRIQNIGLGASHVITQHLVIDTDFGYTRQRAGAQSSIDIADGDFGLSTLGIPGTNGVGPNYVGQPIFALSGGTAFSSLGNTNTGNPFLFRDNQYTGDVNLSWTIGAHTTKYGAEYYHFALNHFQPSAGAGVNNPRGGFVFQGGMTTNTTATLNSAASTAIPKVPALMSAGV